LTRLVSPLLVLTHGGFSSTMWNIDKQPKLDLENKKSDIHFFGLSDLNIRSSFFRTKKSFQSTNVLGLPELVTQVVNTVLTPVESSFLYYLDGLWQPIDSEVAQVYSSIDLKIDSYFHYLDRTYVISDATPRRFVRKEIITVVDPINFGVINQGEIVNRVTSGGLALDFEINSNLNVIINTSQDNLHRGCFARVGQQAEIWLEKEVDPTKINQINPIVFFSKENTGIGFATSFDYLGYNYAINSANQLATLGLVNVVNNRFFIIQPYREVSQFVSWPFWNQFSIWDDATNWSDV